MKILVGSVYRIKSVYRNTQRDYDALCIESRPNPFDQGNRIVGLVNLTNMKRIDYLIPEESDYFESKTGDLKVTILYEDKSKSIPFDQIKKEGKWLKSNTYLKNKIEFDQKSVDKIDSFIINQLYEEEIIIARVTYGIKIYYLAD